MRSNTRCSRAIRRFGAPCGCYLRMATAARMSDMPGLGSDMRCLLCSTTRPCVRRMTLRRGGHVVRACPVLLRASGACSAQSSDKNQNDCRPRHGKHAENREQHKFKTLLACFRVPRVIPGCLITRGFPSGNPRLAADNLLKYRIGAAAGQQQRCLQKDGAGSLWSACSRCRRRRCSM